MRGIVNLVGLSSRPDAFNLDTLRKGVPPELKGAPEDPKRPRDHVMSEKAKARLREAMRGRKGHLQTEETKCKKAEPRRNSRLIRGPSAHERGTTL